MTYSLHQQHVDLAAGMHILELRNEHGHTHIVQIAIGHDACPACGNAHPKDGLNELDPKAMVQGVIDALNESHANQQAYAAKHGLQVR